MSDESESEESWFEVCPKGVGRSQPRPIDELCSMSSDSSSASDATSARWYETFTTRVARHSRPVGLGRSLDRRSRDVRVATRRTEEKFTAALVLSVEARAFSVSPGTQETLVMLEAALLTASSSVSLVERQVRARSKLSPATATSILTSTHVSPASLFFPGRRLLQTHLQAERRKRLANV